MWETLKHLGLSEEGENRRALTRLTNLTWFGDSQDNMEKWNNEALLAGQAAERAGVKNETIVARLRECLEKSTRFQGVLEAWLEMRRNGSTPWDLLM